MSFDCHAHVRELGSPLPGRFVVAVLLPREKSSSKDKKDYGYVLVLSNREPRSSVVGRFPLQPDDLPSEWRPVYEPGKDLPSELEDWLVVWATQHLQDIASELSEGEVGSARVGRDDLFGEGAAEDETRRTELRAFFLRPGAADFLEDVEREAPDVATWLRTHAPEHRFKIETVVPSADT